MDEKPRKMIPVAGGNMDEKERQKQEKDRRSAIAATIKALDDAERCRIRAEKKEKDLKYRLASLIG